ncbi:MAG: nucleoside triphosphate pyrophosphohydrolase [Ktedonobacterales bacterium]|nr:nucleoside triphosphate pyrophosphohydrolase [Ktedonobacterales bacterium]
MPRTKKLPPASGSLTIVGLGPGAWEDVTVAAQQTLEAAPRLIFRTLRHPTVEALRTRRPDLTLASFDEMYEQADGWQGLYVEMAERLLAVAATEPLTYAVPGHPLIGEASVRLVGALAQERGIPTRIIAGLSFIEPICARLNLDPIADGLQIVDATELADLQPQQIAGALTTTRPLLISQVFNRRMASAAKLALLEVFPPTWEVTLVQAAGLPEERVRAVPLGEADRDDFADHLTSLYVPALPPASLQALRTPEALRYVVARLRAPDGCPWDRQQTHASLTPYVLEEAAEVADAIEEFAEDPMHLAEELGDLLLQVYLHTEIAQEEDAFTIGDVFEAITAKLIRRHPHVFGDVAVTGADQVVANWEAIKRTERADADGQPPFESRLKRIPRHTAALAATHDTQRRAVKAGFDWPTLDDWVAKLHEETRELVEATTPEAQADELGDLLFTVVALARRLDIDAEMALRAANGKFRRRFQQMEMLAHTRGLAFEELDRDTHLRLWGEAKAAVG